MGQTAFIFLNNGNTQDTTGVTGHGLRIYAATTGTNPKGVIGYTASQPDGMPVNNVPPASCAQTYSLIKNGAGMVDVSINGNTIGLGGDGNNALTKGDDNLHDQPYTQIYPPGAEYTAVDKGTWVPSSGYGNILGRLTFSDTVSGSASFSAPN
jgi:hypothetical protein